MCHLRISNLIQNGRHSQAFIENTRMAITSNFKNTELKLAVEVA